MQWCINDFEVFLAFDNGRVDANSLHHIEIKLVNLFADDFYQLRITLKFHVGHFHLVNLVNNTLVVRSQNLRAIFPISLVAIVLAGVVASRNIHAALASKVPDSKRTLGCWAHIVEQVHLNAVGRKYVCYRFSKQSAVVSAVVANGHLNKWQVGEVLFQVVGQSLCCHTHSVDIHSVATSAHDTTQAARSKLQVFVESVDKTRLIGISHQFFHFFPCLFVKLGSKPLFGFCLALSYQLSVILHNLYINILNLCSKPSKTTLSLSVWQR